MIQDIYPYRLYNEFAPEKPDGKAIIMCFDNRTVLTKNNDADALEFPLLKDIEKLVCADKLIYLFCINEMNFYLSLEKIEVADTDYSYENINIFRAKKPKHLAYAGMTAFHLFQWYSRNVFCGKCGHKLSHDEKLRMLRCDSCNNTVFPAISPAVIVGIISGNRILLTKYAGREYVNYSLVAGYVEIGETLEDAVRRETMEEVGLKLKNITYFSNQPWGFDSNMLIGYFAELDGDDNVVLDEQELSVGEWFERDKVPYKDNGISLTGNMIDYFMKNDVSEIFRNKKPDSNIGK